MNALTGADDQNGPSCRSGAINIPLADELKGIGIDDSSIIDQYSSRRGQIIAVAEPPMVTSMYPSRQRSSSSMPYDPRDMDMVESYRASKHYAPSATESETGYSFDDEERCSERRRIPCWLISVCAVLGLIGLGVLVLFLVSRFYGVDEIEGNNNGWPESESLRDHVPLENYVLTLLPEYTLANLDFEEVGDNPSPQTQAFHWLMNDPEVESYPNWRILQRFAMATVYFATGGNNTWLVETNWMSYDHHENDWHWSLSFARQNFQHLPFDPAEFLKQGILEEVTHLWLFNNSLSGTIPPEIGLLTHLKSIDLVGNNLVGSIPSSIGNLDKLMGLLLNTNELSGNIPTEIGNLHQLLWVTAFQNQLQGSIPSELGVLPLWSLQLDANELTGSIPLELGNLTNVLWLRLHNNSLTGSIPSEVGLMTALQLLDFSLNELTGSLPSQLGSIQMADLDLSYYLDLAKQSIVLDLKYVREFNTAVEGAVRALNGNSIQLHSNDLTGSIPSELGGLTFNGLKDCVSYIVGDHVHCNGLDLHNNLLSGSLPLLSETLGYFDVSANRLQGSIPRDFGLGALEYVDASHNALTGSIPDEIRKWKALEVANFSYNELSGPIPAASIFVLASNESKAFDFQVVENSMLTGTLPWAVCGISTSTIGFTCSELLCGCDCGCR